jgi:hypothetical protein
MQPPFEFSAPWSRGLLATSLAATALFFGVAAFGYLQPGLPAWARWTLTTLPLLTLVGAALWTVRGYVLEPGVLRVRRLLWDTCLPLDGLESARWDPEATRGSLRLFGNGGLYSYHGWFWNRRLGRYRLYATDPKRAVVLRFARRTIVVSPGEPADFVRALPTRRAAP